MIIKVLLICCVVSALAVEKLESGGWRGLAVSPSNHQKTYQQYIPKFYTAASSPKYQLQLQSHPNAGYMFLELPAQAAHQNIPNYQSLLSSFNFNDLNLNHLTVPFSSHFSAKPQYAVKESDADTNDIKPHKNAQILQTVPAFHEFGRKFPVNNLQDLGESISHGKAPTKLVKITKTVGVKVPVAYPVKIPYHVPVPYPVHKPYPINVPQLIKVPEPQVGSHYGDFAQQDNYQQDVTNYYSPQQGYQSPQYSEQDASQAYASQTYVPEHSQFQSVPQYAGYESGQQTHGRDDSYISMAEFKASIERGLKMAQSHQFEKAQNGGRR